MRILIVGGLGYVGSALFPRLVAAGHDVAMIDTGERGNRSGVENRCLSLRSVSLIGLAKGFDAVIVLAGRTSVAAAKADPRRAYQENVDDLVRLAMQLDPGQPLFFASSAAVMSPGTQAANNIYDSTKRVIEDLVPTLHPNSYVLRFGTVCGAADNLRPDMIINRMVRDALVSGEITVANPTARRPILGTADLCAAAEVLLKGEHPRGIYRLASFNTTVEYAAHRVSRLLGVPLLEVANSPTYDFVMEPSPIGGYEPRETLETIVEGLVALHERVGLGSFE